MLYLGGGPKSATAHQAVVGTVKTASDGFEAVDVFGALGEAAHGLVVLDLRLKGELNGISSGLGAEVVHARLEALAPAVEVHGRDLGGVRINHVDVEGLALVNVGASVGGHVQDALLLDFPRGLVHLANVLWDGFNGLDGPFVTENVVLHGQAPQVQRNEVLHQVLVQHHELTGQGPTNVQVGGEGFEALVVPEDLRG